jgi:anti-sigma B factor antagonist
MCIEQSVSVISLNGCAVVSLSGEPGLAAVQWWRKVLAGLVKSGPRRVVVDMSGLSRLGARAADVLVEAQEGLMARGRSLAVACPPGPVARELEVTGADQRLPVYASVAAAVAGRVRFPLD